MNYYHVVYEIFCTVVESRLIEATESMVYYVRNGFRKGRGCLDNIVMQSYKYLRIALNEFLDNKAKINEAVNKGRKAL